MPARRAWARPARPSRAAAQADRPALPPRGGRPGRRRPGRAHRRPRGPRGRARPARPGRPSGWRTARPGPARRPTRRHAALRRCTRRRARCARPGAARPVVRRIRSPWVVAVSGAGRAAARPPRCAGSRWSRRRSGRPARRGSRRAIRPGTASQQLGLGAEQVERGGVDGHVRLGPEDLVGAGLGSDRMPEGHLGRRPVGVEPVGLGLHVGLGHRVGGCGRAAARRVEPHEAVGCLGVTGAGTRARARSRRWPWRPTSPHPPRPAPGPRGPPRCRRRSRRNQSSRRSGGWDAR